jgi:HK97 family phage major capsid protein
MIMEKEQTLYRSYTNKPEGVYDAETRTLRLAVASETPVDRYGVAEVLSMEEQDIDLSRLRNGAPLLLHHNPETQIGVVTKVFVGADKVLRAEAKISQRSIAQGVVKDIEDGIISKVSVGYERVKELTRSDVAGGVSVRWAWRPLEVSIVSIAADDTVGVGRSAERKQEVSTMEKNETREVVQPTEPKVDIQAIRSQERERVAGITQMGRKHNMVEQADKAVDEGKSLSEFRQIVLDKIEREQAAQPAKPVQTAAIGMTDKEVQRYSFLKAIRSLSGERVDAGFERELSAECERKFGRAPRGMYVPWDVQVGGQRALEAGGTGANVIATDLRTDLFIDLLRNKLATVNLGVGVMGGLVGDIEIPRQSAATTAYWISEGNAPADSDVTLAQVAATPHTVGARTDITRRMLLQSSMDAEQFIRNDLAAVLARAIDNAAFSGTGALGQPLGLVLTPGVLNPAVTTDAPTYAQMIGFKAAIKAANADIGTMKWAMTSGVWEILSTTIRTAGTDSKMLLDAEGDRFLGREFLESENLPDNSLFLGIWNQMMICMWGVLDITADRSALVTSGGVRVVALQDVDVIVRYPECFAFNDAVRT